MLWCCGVVCGRGVGGGGGGFVVVFWNPRLCVVNMCKRCLLSKNGWYKICLAKAVWCNRSLV